MDGSNGEHKAIMAEVKAVQDTVNGIRNAIDRMFQPDGVCDARHNNAIEAARKNEVKIEGLKKMILAHRWIIGFLIGAIGTIFTIIGGK